MKKQKAPSRAALHLQALHRRRTGWFAVLLVGLLLIQFVYNIHNGQPRILGYSAKVESAQLHQETNQARARQRLAPLQHNATLSKAAQAKVEDMVAKKYWGHVAPDGTTPWHFFEQAGYSYQAAGENLAYGFLSSNEVIGAWMQSESHRANVLGDYTEVGFGVKRATNFEGNDTIVVVAFYGTPKTSQTSAKAVEGATITSPSSHKVNGFAVIASGGASWAMYASFGLLIAATLGFIVTHLELLRLGWYRSKRYVALHPVFDTAVIVIIAIVLAFTAGGNIL